MKIRYMRVFNLLFGFTFLICLTVSAFSQNMFRKVNDFDGDGKADYAITRDIDGQRYWYVWQSTQGFRVFQWGISTDQNISGDYDGDGKTDFAIYRKTPIGINTMDYFYWIYGSQNGTRIVQTFPNNAYPDSFSAPQDYDGDGKTDFARTVEANARLQIIFNSGGSTAYSLSGKLIKMGDTDGDGKAEIATFNQNNQTVTSRNHGQNTFRNVRFGLADDQFVAADFDGDGKGEIAIFRESDGIWWWIRSSDNVLQAAQFGKSGDKPVPADYHGDGKTDLAIWRPGETQSVYWVYGSQAGIYAFAWGVPNDTVVTY